MIKFGPLQTSFWLFCRFLSLIAIDKKNNNIHFVLKRFTHVISGASDIFLREGMLLLSISLSLGVYLALKFKYSTVLGSLASNLT